MKTNSNMCINYVLVGPRDKSILHESMVSVRKFSSVRINLFADEEAGNTDEYLKYENIEITRFQRVKYHVREENRNSSLFRLLSIQESSKRFELSLYLDNDIVVVHEGFFEGFDIAKHFGFSMVENPRTFITTLENDMGDIDIGVDVLPYDEAYLSDMPHYMTAYNMGVMFYNSQHPSSKFLQVLIEEQMTNPSRGQAGLYRSMWKSKFAPYCLPVNWLVCNKHVGIKRPLALHCGHNDVLRWWKEMKSL